MKEIPLANGRGVALVDDEDYQRLSQYRWRLHPKGYAVRNGDNNRARLMHHDIADFHRLRTANAQIDHHNRNRLDNQKSNLRAATRQQNAQNKASKSNTTSRYKGVYWGAKKQRWFAAVYSNGKCVFHRSFKTEEEAAKAYDEAARKVHGDFAYQNISHE